MLATISVAAQSELSPQQYTGNSNPQSVTIVVPSSNTNYAEYAEVPEYDWMDYRHSFSLSVGLPGLYSTAMGKHSWDFYIAKTATGGSTTPRRDFFCGAWAIDYGFQALRWLRVGLMASYEYWMGTSMNTHDAALLAKVDFTYINREHLRLYSGVGLGVGTHIEKYSDGTIAGRYLPAVIGTPIGLNVGSPKVYALIETNVGSASFLRVGVGFRP